MRTTLDIADDVLLAVRERARRERKSAGEVLSDLARAALTGVGAGDEVAESESFYGFEPAPRRGSIITNELVNRLREGETE